MTAPPTVPALALDGIVARDADRELFSGVTLHLAAAECVAVVGANGCGKSLLLQIAAGLVEPDAGTVALCGRELARLAPEELTAIRTRLGFAFQAGGLLSNRTVAANVSLPLRFHARLTDAEIRDRLEQRLRSVGLWDERDRFPAQLSLSQRRLSGICRAFMLDPDLVLLDEPLTGLDPHGTAVILEQVEQLKRRGAALLITGSDAAALGSIADRVAVLGGGRIAAAAAPAELAAHPDPAIRAYFGAAGG